MYSKRTHYLSRRNALAGAAALAGSGALAACAVGGSAGSQGAVPAASKPVGTVQFWHAWSTRQPVLRPYLDRFEQENPGVKVEDTDATVMGGRMKLVTAILAGSPPDSFHLFADFLPEVVPSKVMRNLRPYVTRDKVDLKAFYDTEVKAYTFGSDLIALPVIVTTNAHFVYWNKDLFRRVGLDPEAGPKTWGLAQEMALKLTVRQGTEVQQLGFDPGAPGGRDIPSNQFIRWLYQNGGKLMSDDGKKVAFQEPAGLETLEWLNQVVARQAPYDAARARTGGNAFFRRELAMIVQQDNFGSQLRVRDDTKTMPWGIALLPTNERNPRSKATAPAISGHGYGVPRDAKLVEGGWALTKYLTYGDAACGFITKDQGRFAPLRRCAEIPEVKEQPEFKVFVAGAQTSALVPQTSANPQIAAILGTQIQAMFEGQQSAKAALEAAAREAQAELDKAVVLQG